MMRKMLLTLTMALAAGLPILAQTDAATIAKALSAGPADITKNASVMEVSADGKMKMLRPGTNGWMCMAAPEAMCSDKEWHGWTDAWLSKKDPQIKAVGIAYMLRGD